MLFLAHATWFTDAQPGFDLAFATSPVSVIVLASAITVALVWRRGASLLLRRPEIPWLRGVGRLGPWIPRILAAHAGVSLLALAASRAYLTPSLTLPLTWWGLLLTLLEAVVGIWLVLGRRVRPAAWLLVIAGPLGMLGFGFQPILERADLLGVGLFLALLPPNDLDAGGRIRIDPDRIRSAVFALRLLLGTALIVAAVTEKLARPEMSLAFLQEYPMFNVAQLAGLPVGDLTFVQVAGGIEVLFGLLLISGALPQVVALLALPTFGLPVAFLGAPELIGHLPIYGALLALFAFGSRADTAYVCSWLPRRASRRSPTDRAPAPPAASAPSSTQPRSGW